jgi:hypothetical protein
VAYHEGGQALRPVLASLHESPFGGDNGLVPGDYLTQGYDVARSGWNPNETILNVDSVKGLHLLFNQPVDGQVYAQPLYAQNLQMSDGAQHNVVFVATEANSVYAFDAETNARSGADPLWHVLLLADGESPCQGATDLDTCDNIHPLVGITATPVIDIAANSLYVVKKSKSDADFHYRLHALDLTSGNEQPNSPVDIQVDNFDPHWHNNRAGLLLNDSKLYIAFGAHCDKGTYHGWVISYAAQELHQVATFDCSPGAGAGDPGSGIWQCGIGLTSDEDGNVYCTTGNGAFTANTPGGQDYGNSALKLSPDLTLLDYFTPFNQANLNANDWDLGSGGPVILPEQTGAAHPRRAVVCGKQGMIYLLDRAGDMGKYNGKTGDRGTDGPDRVIQSIALYPDRVPTGPGRPAGSDALTPGVYGAPCYYGGP